MLKVWLPEVVARLLAAASCLWVALAGAAAVDPEALEPEADCAAQYDARMMAFLNLSGTATRFEPDADVFTDWRRAVSWAWTEGAPRGQGEYLSMIVRQARLFLAECHAFGGRFWEMETKLKDYVASMSEEQSDLLRSHVHASREHLLAHKHGHLRFSLCAPAACDEESIRRRVTPRYLATLLTYLSDLPLPEPAPDHVQVEELSDWSSVDLDFVIAGVQACGTSTLWQNLAKHPEIGFIHGLESDTDYFFALSAQRRLLPTKAIVGEFNGRWSSGGRRKPAIGGLRHVKILQYGMSRVLAAQVPRLIPIVVLCDPVGRAEKQFLTKCKNHAHEVDGGIAPERCRQNIVDFFGDPPSNGRWPEAVRRHYWKELLLRDDLREMHRLFGRRLVVFHQDRYREDVRGVFDSVAEALGATRPFPKDMDFGHYNSVRGLRSDLCLNATLVRHLTNQLEGEFRAQERLLSLAGEPVPESLAKRLSRCDRASLSRGSIRACDQFTRCDF